MEKDMQHVNIETVHVMDATVVMANDIIVT